MKIALCFIIHYSNQLNKEALWKEWIEPNKDIINVYFHYNRKISISSDWIKSRAMPADSIANTSYLHVVSAYISILKYAVANDVRNIWFCFLTESCVPIISPKKFRKLFKQNYRYSLMKWSVAWWNTQFHRRANLYKIPEDFWLANDPWFILKREDVFLCLKYAEHMITKSSFNLVCAGDIANESIFAIIFKTYNCINNIKNACTHLTDWTRMESPTSPHLFKTYNLYIDGPILKKLQRENPYACFLRKVAPEFPDEVLKKIIYKKDDNFSLFSLLMDFFWFLLSFFFKS